VRIALPILVAAIVVSLFSTWFNDRVVTKANRLGQGVKHHDIEGRPRADPDLKENFHFLGENGSVLPRPRYNHATKTLYGRRTPTVRQEHAVRRVDAKNREVGQRPMVFMSGFERVFESETERVRAFDDLAIPELRELPEDFAKEESTKKT